MNQTAVYLETGKKKVFAGAVDWPGWCRYGRDADSALQALMKYASRYARVLYRTEAPFTSPYDVSSLVVVERYEGNATTDFGSPAIIPDTDRGPMGHEYYQRSICIMQGCWDAFDDAAGRAYGRELKKGPRGGGRNLDKIIQHVVDADRNYLSRLAWKFKKQPGQSVEQKLTSTRQAIQEAMDLAMNEGLPEKGPRGGIIWPLQYFVRRVCWHVLDHTWEIEDRIV